MKREKARRSLTEFVRQAWPIVEPEPLVWGWHLDALCLHLEAVSRGEIKQLVINIGPGYAKSLIVAVLWPAWVWASKPEWRAIFASYAYSLAERDSQRCRNLIRSDWYQGFRARGRWEISADQDTKGYYVNTKRGFRFSTAVGAQATGWRGDAVIVDDPISAKEYPSSAARAEAIFWWDHVMSSRVNDLATGAFVVIMQRLHEDDLTGHLLRRGGVEHLCLPSEFEAERRCVTYHTVEVPANGIPAHKARTELWRDPRTVEGDLLFPAKFSTEALATAKEKLGTDGYAGQHQQRPTPAGGGMFKRAWWRFWKPDGTVPDCIASRPPHCSQDPARPLPALDGMLISVDANFKDKAGADPVSILVVGWKGADRFLLDRAHGPFGFTRTVAVLRDMCARWPKARKKLVEAKANGDAIIETLRTDISGIVGVEPEGGKEARAWAIQPQAQAGNCYLPDGAPWLDEFISEFAAFPLGRHDDDVDAWSQALIDLCGPPPIQRGPQRVRGA